MLTYPPEYRKWNAIRAYDVCEEYHVASCTIFHSEKNQNKLKFKTLMHITFHSTNKAFQNKIRNIKQSLAKTRTNAKLTQQKYVILWKITTGLCRKIHKKTWNRLGIYSGFVCFRWNFISRNFFLPTLYRTSLSLENKKSLTWFHFSRPRTILSFINMHYYENDRVWDYLCNLCVHSIFLLRQLLSVHTIACV